MYEKLLNYHKCTADELRSFKEPTRDTYNPLQRYIEGTDRYLFCVEQDAHENGTLSVWGLESDDNYQRFEFNLVPCNYIHKQMGDIGDVIDPTCNSN